MDRIDDDDDTTTRPGPENEDDDVVFLTGEKPGKYKREKYIDEVKDPTERIRRKPR